MAGEREDNYQGYERNQRAATSVRSLSPFGKRDYPGRDGMIALGKYLRERFPRMEGYCHGVA
jgi:hypothetical protein